MCLILNQHESPSVLACRAVSSEKLPLAWVPHPDQDQLRACYADHQEATEEGACGVAIAYLHHTHKRHVIARAAKDGGGFDYFVGPTTVTSIFGGSVDRLEVSGVLHGDEHACRKRLAQKKEQVCRHAANGQQRFAVVVGFREPAVWMEVA